MITAFSTQHKFQSKRDETLLLQTDLSRANTVIPKPIQWKDVHLPEEWILEGAAPPAIPKQLEPNTELQNVTQYSDGKVKLSFRRSTSSRFSDKASCSSIPSLERKFTKVPSVINLPFQSQPRFSTSDIPSTSIRSVDYTTSVPHPIYTSSQHIQSQEEKEPSPPTSPTFSAVTENVINVIEKEFELDKTLLHNDFYSDLNKEKRLWFFKHFLNQRKEIQQFYYKFVNLHKVHILFFDWFEIYSSDNNIAYPFKESNPITIRKKTTEWKLSDSNRTVDSEHPPLRSVTVDHGEPPIEIRASPYKIPKPNDTDSNLSSIIQQNNFCSTNLNTIGKQLTRIENQFQQSTISVSPSQKPIPSKSDSDKKLKEPIFKPFQVSKTSQKLAHESKSDFAKAIREQLDRIEAASSSSSKVQIALDTPQSSKIGVLEKDDQTSIASSDLEAFIDEPISKANKIHWELAIPTSKSPPDLTIDNRPSALNQARYNASSVYEWNIDGMSEYNILGVLQQMTMAANAYKTQSGTSDKAIAEILIAGFTGQLKGWWDHLLTKLQQLDIFNAIQTDENGAPILDEFNNPIQDAVATLILTISLHFIGDPSHLRDKNAELLHNLRCRKLSDFQEYKTTFFTRLFLRDDANHVTWKEKFLAGLPTLLGEKVRNSIKALYDNRIPYDELTYGELVSFVNKEGLKICQDLKLQKRLKQELRRSKQELGGFCKQFNYDPFKASTSKDCNGKCSTKPYKKYYKSKNHRKPFHEFRKLPYKKPSRPYKKHSFSKKKEFKAKPKTPFNFKDATCFKCGMKGHTAKFCRMNKRLQELDLNEDILSKIAPLLIESSDSESSMSGDNDPLQVDELFDSDTSASSSSNSDSNSYLKKINVLTKDQEIFLELVKHISDPNLQKEYLDKLLKTMDSDKAGTSTEISKVPIIKKNSYDLTQILDKKKTNKAVPNIQDLQKEIKEIKCEIRDLKEKQKSDSETIQLLLQKQLQDNSDNESNPDDGEDIKVENIESVPNDFLFVLKQITTRKYLIKVTLIFSDDFAMDAIALFDTGADLNCIREDIVPKRFHEKTKERLSAANNSKLNSKLTVNMIKDWLSSKNLLQPTLEASKAQQTFLTQKSKAQSLLASAKTEDEYFKAMEQLLASRSKSSAADSSEDEDEDVDDDEEPFISLGDDNEDDCFGIFSPIKHCLPTLLGEKVRNSIKALYDNRIPYDELTYGELVSFVNKEGLKICQDLKLQKRLKQELRRSKQELGGFCKQFNYDPFKASTSKDCNGKCSTKPYKKYYKSKNHRKPFHEFRKLPYKKPSRPYKKHSFSKKEEFKAKPKTPFNFKDATCFKCGMKGHTAKFCRMNKRLQELDLNEDILSKIAPLLIESSDSESSMSGDNDPLQVDELFDSDTSASSSSNSDSNSYLKKINVLTKDQEIFLELVKHISDPNLQKEYLDKLLKTMDSDKAGTSTEISKVPIIKKNSYDLTQILDKKKTNKAVPNIQDLQKEIKEIKCEIRDLKEKQKSDSETIQLLLQKQLQDNSDNESNPDDGEDIKVENIESVPNDFLFVLKQITTRKYLIKVTLIFSDDFAMDAIALFDTGADLNCIREDIVPKRFHEKTKERLSAANNSKLNSKLTVNMIKDWLSSKNLLQPTLEASKAQQTFLTQKSKAQSLLASAKTEDEYFKAMEQLLASRSKSSAADSSEDEDEDVDDDEEPFISLGDDNEDDCFGIFSPIKHCK
ncbi:hypothetical protein KPL70_008828 [Citrus sinensis]|nr:hypothetical protein KPL70_008828 [Citrus sinensis]